jgi:hypothetical protein
MIISRYTLIATLLLQCFVSLAWAGESGVRDLFLSAPGDRIITRYGEYTTRENFKEQDWHAAILEQSDLIIEHVLNFRKSDWLIATGSSTVKLGKPARGDGIAPSMPANAVFAFRMSDEYGKPVSIKPGKFHSLIQPGQVMHKGWKDTFSFDGAKWSISAEYKTRPDGKPLDGSMSLQAVDAAGQITVLVPPATGMAFSREEILWLGDINGDKKPDLILKRVWVTNETDYIFVLGSTFRSLYVDEDYPYQKFSSGAMDEINLRRHINQKEPLPGRLFSTNGFAISEETWSKGLQKFSEKDLPHKLWERRLKLGDESISFSFEYLPRYNAYGAGASSQSDGFFWGGPVLVKVNFRGETQVLMQAYGLDGNSFRINIDKVNGQPAIKIGYQPHYNNDLSRYWIWKPAPDGRFIRLFNEQSQGC